VEPDRLEFLAGERLAVDQFYRLVLALLF